MDTKDIDVVTAERDAEAHEIKNSSLGKKTLWKIDMRIIPLLFITYNFNFMDKTILSSAAVFGLEDSTHLTGSDYSWVSSIFYFGYLFWEYPTSIFIQRLPVAKYVSINTFFWGVVVAATAGCVNYGGLLTVRFLLGVAEATISPAFLYITSMWYTRSEIPTRVGIWFAGNSLGGVVSSFIAYGLGHVERPLEPWQWMFIVLGSATFLWGFVLLFFLPDSIESCKFLSPEEKECAEQRVVLAGTGKAKHAWKPAQTIECLRDPKTFFFFAISLLTQIPNGGTQNFGNLVLQGFGYSSLDTTLLTLPASFISFFTIIITGRIAGKWMNISTYVICGIVLCPVSGSAIIYAKGPSLGVKLFGYYLLATGPAALPVSMSLVGVNYKGSTKKMTMTAILFLAYCAGNISGPQFFKDSEAPHYPTAFRAIMISYALVLVMAMGLRLYLMYENKSRDRAEGIVTGDGGGGIADPESEVEETTDWKSPGFRYRM